VGIDLLLHFIFSPVYMFHQFDLNSTSIQLIWFEEFKLESPPKTPNLRNAAKALKLKGSQSTVSQHYKISET